MPDEKLIDAFLDIERKELWDYHSKLHDVRQHAITSYLVLVAAPAVIVGALLRTQLNPPLAATTLAPTPALAILGFVLVVLGVAGVAWLCFYAVESSNADHYWTCIRRSYQIRRKRLELPERFDTGFLRVVEQREKTPPRMTITDWRMLPVVIVNSLVLLAGIASLWLGLCPTCCQHFGGCQLVGALAVLIVIADIQWRVARAVGRTYEASRFQADRSSDATPPTSASEIAPAGGIE